MHTLKAATRALWLTAILMIPFCLCGQSAKPLELCAALANFQAFAGKVITVEGAYIVGREIEALYGTSCKPVFVNGVSRPVAAWLRFRRVSGMETNQESIQTFREFVIRHRASAENPGIQVTIMGRLNTEDEIPTYTDPSGKKQLLGFGHLGAFPSQIDVIDIHVIDRDKR